MRYSSRARKSMTVKILIAVLSLALCTIFAVGGTLAWLTDKTGEVKNTFTFGDINIDLTEQKGSESGYTFKMIPGKEIAKDPTVTVKANSEACWLFVKVEKSANFEDFMTWAIADGWTALPGQTGIYYRPVSNSASDQNFAVLAGNKVLVKNTVTKAMFEELTDETKPTLTFTAYAVQQDGYEDNPSGAWTIASANANA